MEIITEEFDNDPENYDEDGSYIADDKEIFNTTREYLLRKYLKSTQENLLPENVKKWLTHLCIGVSLNFSTDFGNDEDTLQELFCSKIKKGDELGCMY